MEDEVSKELKNIEQKMKTQLGEICKEFGELKVTIESKGKSKVTRKEIKEINSRIQEKVSLKEVQSAINSM